MNNPRLVTLIKVVYISWIAAGVLTALFGGMKLAMTFLLWSYVVMSVFPLIAAVYVFWEFLQVSLAKKILFVFFGVARAAICVGIVLYLLELNGVESLDPLYISFAFMLLVAVEYLVSTVAKKVLLNIPFPFGVSANASSAAVTGQ